MIRIFDWETAPRGEIFARESPTEGVADIVAPILADVRQNGDEALIRYGEMFDGVRLESLEVTQQEIDEAFACVGAELLEVIRRAEANIRAYHEKQVRAGYIMSVRPGVVLGQKVTPIEKVGLYVPGGTAAYPSTVLMDAVPAKIAGCREIVMVTPPGRGTGKVDPAILAAAKIAGVSRIFKLGGAQAVAALAYGTQSVPRVDKIVGPGNAFVAEAKKQVFGVVAIDVVAGPSEILIVADGNNDPRILAADMLSQAEHDKLSSAVLVTTSEPLARCVAYELEAQLSTLPREEIARASIENNGKIIVAPSIAAALEIANEIAPEHLEICVDDPFAWLPEVKNAGSIFLGRNSPEVLGDYLAGPNHTLPTGGSARFASPLGVDDFVKRSQFTYYTREAFCSVAEDLKRFADSEGLHGHARAAQVRQNGGEAR